MTKGESLTIFDRRRNSMQLYKPEPDGTIEIFISGISGQAKFYAHTNAQNAIIEHSLSYSPDCENIVLRRMSYELQTLQNHFDRVLKKYHEVNDELEKLKNNK